MLAFFDISDCMKTLQETEYDTRERQTMRGPAEVYLARAAPTTVNGLGRDQNCRQVGLGAASVEADGTKASNGRSLKTVVGKAEGYVRDEN